MALDRQEIRKKYDEIAPSYDRLEAVVEGLGLRSLRRSALATARGHVLEVAIGTGKNIPLYGGSVQRLVGIDLSPAMLEHARNRAGAAPFAVELAEADALHLPFTNETFDTVTSALSTCTIPDPVAAIAEMRRVLKPDGRILLLEHGRSSSSLLARLQDWRAEAHERMLGCRWNQDPQAFVREAGLELIEARRAFFGVFHVLEAASPARNRTS